MTVLADEQLAAQAVEAGAYEEAVRLLRPLVERNSEYALLTLGWIYETGAIGAPEIDAARLCYEHAAAQGSALAYLYLGWLLDSQGDESQARAAFERGAELENVECRSELERLIDEGDEKLAEQAVEAESYDQAIGLLQPLAERNSQYALLTLGWIYETGATGAPDKDAARLYYERAAAAGSARSYRYLGRLLSGQGEEGLARAAFEAGAERGDLPCMAKLGMMMVEGRGGPTDIGAGSAWLNDAAARGHIFARRNLLGIEARNARSIFGKLFVGMKVVLLAIKGAREMARNARSDKVL